MIYGLGIITIILLAAFPPIPHFEWNTPEIYGYVTNSDGRPVSEAYIEIHGDKNKIETTKSDNNGYYEIKPNKTFHFVMATQAKPYSCIPVVYVSHENFEVLKTKIYLDRNECKGNKFKQDLVLTKKNNM